MPLEQQLRSLFRFKANNGVSHPPASYCATCVVINIKRILRDGLEENVTSLGFLIDIIKKSDHCVLCRLIATLVRRQWRLDDHPNIDLQGIKCSLTASRYGYIHLHRKRAERKCCHRLNIIPSDRPWEACSSLMNASADLSLAIQLMEEDAHKVSRKRDFHGRRMKDVVDVGMIKRWIHLCESEHGDTCESIWWRAKDEGLPGFVRMVDVVQMALVPALPNCRYVALSYVWGGPGDSYWTTRANVTARGSPDGLDNSILPATIADSIRLVQQLGEQYLWIDALCIIQDSLEDKADQIHIMGLIYSRATFTICAAGGDSARAGLPGLTAGSRTCQQHIEVIHGLHLALPLPSVKQSATQSSWNTRGWTFQELVLSRRRVIFTKDQVYFECIKEVWCEDVIAESPAVRPPLAPQLSIAMDMFLRPSYDVRTYATQVKQYMQRRLTQESDIVAAMTALTNSLAEGFGATDRDPKKSFWFCMWITNLDYALLWQPELGVACYPRRRITDLEHSHWPTWTWAGWKGAVNYNNETQLSRVEMPFPTFHAGSIESLVPAWYMVTEDGEVVQLDVPKIPGVRINRTNDPEEIPPPRYIAPVGYASDADVGFSPPAGTLIFRTRCARFQVIPLSGVEQSGGKSEVYTVFQIFPVGVKFSKCIGRIILPSSIPSPVEFIVLSRCTSGTQGIYDEEFWGKRYHGCMLHVMAVQQERDDLRIRKRVGVGVIVEAAWLKGGLELEERVVLLA